LSANCPQLRQSYYSKGTKGFIVLLGVINAVSLFLKLTSVSAEIILLLKYLSFFQVVELRLKTAHHQKAVNTVLCVFA
jgi:hypothetical protein